MGSQLATAWNILVSLATTGHQVGLMHAQCYDPEIECGRLGTEHFKVHAEKLG